MSDKESHVTTRTWRFGGGKSYRLFTLKAPSTIYPKSSLIYPPSNRPILSKISNAHNIMLCFTKVFSAKDQLENTNQLIRKMVFAQRILL